MREPAIDPWLREYNLILQKNDSFYRVLAKRLGVGECTLWILYSLRAEAAPMTQKRLCQLLLQPKQTVNSALKAMEAEGCITLAPGRDRRTREVVLTKRGVDLAKRTADQVIQAEEQALARMSEARRQAFLEGFQSFTRLLWESLETGSEKDPGGSTR